MTGITFSCRLKGFLNFFLQFANRNTEMINQLQEKVFILLLHLLCLRNGTEYGAANIFTCSWSVPLDKGNVGSGNEIGTAGTQYYLCINFCRD